MSSSWQSAIVPSIVISLGFDESVVSMQPSQSQRLADYSPLNFSQISPTFFWASSVGCFDPPASPLKKAFMAFCMLNLYFFSHFVASVVLRCQLEECNGEGIVRRRKTLTLRL